AVRAEDYIDDGEARIDLDTERFRLLGEPAAKAAEAPGIAAVIAHERRHGDIRHAEAAGFPEIIEALLGDLRGERRALLPPIWDEAVKPDRVDHRARQDMCADLRALLQDHDRQLLVLLDGELLESDRCGKACRSGADDDDVELHGLALSLVVQASGSVRCKIESRRATLNCPSLAGKNKHRGLEEASQISEAQTAAAALIARYQALTSH